jgi:hypothetical protein
MLIRSFIEHELVYINKQPKQQAPKRAKLMKTSDVNHYVSYLYKRRLHYPHLPSSPANLCSSSSIASSFLRIAIPNGGSSKRARVGGVTAGSVLNRTRALESSGLVDEGRAIDREWAVTSSLDDGGCGTTERTSEGLHVGTGSAADLCCGDTESSVESISGSLSSCSA